MQPLRKNNFRSILVVVIIVLMLLPFVNTFSELMTRIVENTGFYKFIEANIVPYVVKLVMSLVGLFGVKTTWGETMFLIYKGGDPIAINLSWNCLGWQSLVILFATLISGLSGNFTTASKIECVVIGILGTFTFNIIRITVSVLAIVFINRSFASLLHDYLMILFTLVWIIIFWLFSYKYVLEEKGNRESKSDDLEARPGD